MTYHALELPAAQLCTLTANLNRDPKKQRKPYSVDDFTFFGEKDEAKPEYRAAIAYMTLLARDELPGWALFCHGDFKSGAGKTYPTDPAMRGEGFLLLAPQDTENKVKGLMLAEQSVSGKQIEVTWESQKMIVSVPKFDGYVCAKAETEVTVLRQLAEGMRP